MKNYVSLIIALLVIGCVPEFDPLPKGKDFIITQSMVYQDRVDLSSFGVARNQIIYASGIVCPTNQDEPLAEPALQAVAQTLQAGDLPTVIDIGRWSIYTKDSLQRKEHLHKLVFVVECLRKARPDLQFGYYGVVPQRVYEPLVDLKLTEWNAFNEAAKVDLVPHVDAVFPTLFTLYDDPKGWETFAINTLTESKRFNKPVYAVIWPKFHESNPVLNGLYLPAAYWRLELETCFRYCDGIVIWNYEPKINWNSNAGWWKETVAFMEAIHSPTAEQGWKQIMP
ncbi:MAG TPA: hypothetical protein VGK10_04045 [Prolixibacteraceae bacterium]|jgi:hypothetical protein